MTALRSILVAGLAAIAMGGCEALAASTSNEDVAFINSLVDVLGPSNCAETESSYGCLFETDAAQSGGNSISLYIGTLPDVQKRNLRFGLGGSEFALATTHSLLDRLITAWGADTARAITDSAAVWNEAAEAEARTGKTFIQYIWSGAGRAYPTRTSTPARTDGRSGSRSNA